MESRKRQPKERDRDIPVFEQVRIQAQVLVSLVKTLRAELGEERAHPIGRQALADLYRKFGEQWWRGQGGRDLGGSVASFRLRRFVVWSRLQLMLQRRRETMAISFKGAHFPQDIILMGVRWYVAYPLSTRHV